MTSWRRSGRRWGRRARPARGVHGSHGCNGRVRRATLTVGNQGVVEVRECELYHGALPSQCCLPGRHAAVRDAGAYAVWLTPGGCFSYGITSETAAPAMPCRRRARFGARCLKNRGSGDSATPTHKKRPATKAIRLQRRGDKRFRARGASSTYFAAPTVSFSSSLSSSSMCESSSPSFSASILAFLSTSIIEMLSS